MRKSRYVLVVLILLMGMIGYSMHDPGSAESATQKVKKTEQANEQKTLSVSGAINATEHVVLRFQTSGQLGWVGVKEGDYVKKFQKIAVLDQRELQKRLKKYLLAYENDRYAFEQALDDNRTDRIALSPDLRNQAERILKQFQNNLDNSVLDVELQNLALEYSRLYSPIEGLVTRVDAPYAGVNVTPAQAEFEIINPHSVYFSAMAGQKDVIKLKKEMGADIVLDAFPEKTIHGKVIDIAFVPKKTAPPEYEAKIAMDINNSSYIYKYGMTGEVHLAPFAFLPSN